MDGQLKRSADAWDVEKVARMGSETEEVDVVGASEPFVAGSVAVAEKLFEKGAQNIEGFAANVEEVEFVMSALVSKSHH